jgi:NurA-like 5'-3' nuclease
MKRGRLKFGLLYLSLHNQLCRKVEANSIITRKELFCILGKHFLIPKDKRTFIIQEMEKLELIHRENKELIKVLKCDININDNPNEVYKKAGLFTFI